MIFAGARIRVTLGSPRKLQSKYGELLGIPNCNTNTRAIVDVKGEGGGGKRYQIDFMVPP